MQEASAAAAARTETSAATEDQLRSLNNQLHDTDRQLLEARADLDIQAARCQKLTEQLAASEQGSSELQAHDADAVKKLQVAEQQLQQQLAQYEKLQQDSRSSSEQHADQQRQLQNQLQEARQKLSAADALQHQQQSADAEAKTQIRKLQQDEADLRGKLEAAAQQAAAARAAFSAETEKHAADQQNIQRLHEAALAAEQDKEAALEAALEQAVALQGTTAAAADALSAANSQLEQRTRQACSR